MALVMKPTQPRPPPTTDGPMGGSEGGSRSELKRKESSGMGKRGSLSPLDPKLRSDFMISSSGKSARGALSGGALFVSDSDDDSLGEWGVSLAVLSGTESPDEAHKSGPMTVIGKV